MGKTLSKLRGSEMNCLGLQHFENITSSCCEEKTEGKPNYEIQSGYMSCLAGS